MKNAPEILITATEFCKAAHEGQMRKYNNKEYYTHPVNVCFILSRFTNNVDVLIASLLHDVLEDTDKTELEIEDKFGTRVLSLVLEVTNQCHEGNRKARTNAEHERLSKCSKEAKMIKMADRYHNLSEMDGADPGWVRKYVLESEHLLEKISDGCPKLSRLLADEIERRKGLLNG